MQVPEHARDALAVVPLDLTPPPPDGLQARATGAFERPELYFEMIKCPRTFERKAVGRGLRREPVKPGTEASKKEAHHPFSGIGLEGTLGWQELCNPYKMCSATTSSHKCNMFVR